MGGGGIILFLLSCHVFWFRTNRNEYMDTLSMCLTFSGVMSHNNDNDIITINMQVLIKRIKHPTDISRCCCLLLQNMMIIFKLTCQ